MKPTSSAFGTEPKDTVSDASSYGDVASSGARPNWPAQGPRYIREWKIRTGVNRSRFRSPKVIFSQRLDLCEDSAPLELVVKTCAPTEVTDERSGRRRPVRISKRRCPRRPRQRSPKAGWWSWVDLGELRFVACSWDTAMGPDGCVSKQGGEEQNRVFYGVFVCLVVVCVQSDFLE